MCVREREGVCYSFFLSSNSPYVNLSSVLVVCFFQNIFKFLSKMYMFAGGGCSGISGIGVCFLCFLCAFCGKSIIPIHNDGDLHSSCKHTCFLIGDSCFLLIHCSCMLRSVVSMLSALLLISTFVL